MLSREEKNEMLKDAKSRKRQRAFGAAKQPRSDISFDEYIDFLDNAQRIASPATPHKPTITIHNKL